MQSLISLNRVSIKEPGAILLQNLSLFIIGIFHKVLPCFEIYLLAKTTVMTATYISVYIDELSAPLAQNGFTFKSVLMPTLS